MLSKCLSSDKICDHMGTKEQYHPDKQGICLGPGPQRPVNLGMPFPIFSFLFIIIIFLGLHLQHMEGPRLGAWSYSRQPIPQPQQCQI